MKKQARKFDDAKSRGFMVSVVIAIAVVLGLTILMLAGCSDDSGEAKAADQVYFNYFIGSDTAPDGAHCEILFVQASPTNLSWVPTSLDCTRH